MADRDPASALTAEKSPPRGARRKELFQRFALILLCSGLAYAAWYYLIGANYISTDDAYVGADVATVTPLLSAAVTEVRVADTQMVHQGDVLVVLDDADARLALAQARADLGRAERRVRQFFATSGALDAQIAARGADVARALADEANAQASFERASADVDRARLDLRRREALAQSGAVSGEELSNARTALRTAEASLSAAKAGVAAGHAARAQATANRDAAMGNFRVNKALVEGTDVATNPEVLVARAKLDQSALDLTRTILRAPVDGVIARRQVQVGQRVQVGAQLMQIVPINRVFVDANFKEAQLRRVRQGQAVRLTSDLYGGDVVYHGRVTGLAGGSGAAFAIIPAQNATGNWIKVVQRVPVRIALDPKELATHPLRIGLSMTATINISQKQ